MSDITRDSLEEFIALEGDLLDDWELDQWLGLWVDGEVSYEIGPLGVDGAAEASARNTMFLLSDNRFRLEQRVIRLNHPAAHAERPSRSKTRHLYGNLRVLAREDDGLDISFNALIHRSRREREVPVIYAGKVRMRLAVVGGALRIRAKRIDLDMDRIANPGTLSIIL